MRRALARHWIVVMIVAGASAFAVEPSDSVDDRQPSTGGALDFEERHPSFGDFYQHQTIRQAFRFTNRGERVVNVLEVLPRSENGRVEGLPLSVDPGETKAFFVHQPLGQRLGQISIRVGVRTDEPASPWYRLAMNGFVQSAYEPERIHLALGDVDRKRGVVQSFELFSREVEKLEISRVEGAPTFVTVRASERAGTVSEGVRVGLEVGSDAPLGLHGGELRFRSNVPQQPLFIASWSASVFGDVAPEQHPVVFEQLREGIPAVATVRLRSRSGASFEIARAKDLGGFLESVETGQCENESPTTCQILELRLPASKEGSIGGIVEVELEGAQERLPLTYSGWILPAGARVRPLDLTLKEPGGSER